MNKMLTATAVVLALQVGVQAVSAKPTSVHVDADPKAKVVIVTDAPASKVVVAPDAGMFDRLSLFFAVHAPWLGFSTAKTPEPEAKTPVVKDKPVAVPEKPKAVPAPIVEENVPDVICTVSAKGRALVMTVSANRRIQSEAVFNAVADGRNRGDFSTDDFLDLKKGDAQVVPVAYTNVTEGAKLSGAVILNGKEYRCN